MRADRLLQMMLILQTNGKKTASELAKELEVSERTIYRDVVALSTAGVPIYSEKGPGGGILLVEDYRTSLTGLSQEEVHALFMLSVPAAMASLGMSEEMKRALLKLSAALPTSLREAELDVRQRVHFDAGWLREGNSSGSPSLIKDLYRAVWDDSKVRVVLRYAFGVEVEYIVDAYSLVNFGGDWLLVCWINDNFSVLRITELGSLQILDEHFTRNPEFNLVSFWETWKDKMWGHLPTFTAEVQVTSALLSYLSKLPSVTIASMEIQPVDRFSNRVTLEFKHFDDARRILLGFGAAVKVLSPLSLKLTIQDYANQTLKVYQE